jgi:hypothetical protein
MTTGIDFAVLTFACTFAAALLGTFIRTTLPPAHVSKESQDVIRLGMGLVATMTALLLGLVTAAAKGSFDSQDVAIKNTAAGILTLDRLLARYGPETQPTRDLLRQTLAARIETMWPKSSATRSSLDDSTSVSKTGQAAEEIENQILQLSPQTDAQRWYKSEALKLTSETLRTRWRLLSAGGAVPKQFLIVVIFWLSMTFASFGLSAPRNATVMTVFAISTLSVAAAVFLIFELDGPFEGIIRISSGPMRFALANLGR